MLNPFPHKLYLDLPEKNDLGENVEYLGNRKILNWIENSVENGAFARYEKMLHFLHCFQIVSATEALKGACVEERVYVYQK